MTWRVILCAALAAAGFLACPAPASAGGGPPRLTLRDVQNGLAVARFVTDLFRGETQVVRPLGWEGGGVGVNEWSHKRASTITSTVSNKNAFRTHFCDMAMTVEVHYTVPVADLFKNVRRGVGKEVIVTLPSNLQYRVYQGQVDFYHSWQGTYAVGTEGTSKLELEARSRNGWEDLANQKAAEEMLSARESLRAALQASLQQLLNKTDTRFTVRVE